MFPIPYFDQPRLAIGPLTIHAFGVLVAAAVLVGHRVFRWKLKREGLEPRPGERLLGWVLVGGFLGAHLVDRLVYYPGETLADPVSLIKIWNGLSSFGGFLGAILGAWLCVRKLKAEEPTFDAWVYLDAVAFAFPFGWIFGRLGCFVAFDHPGVPTDFFLGQYNKEGTVIHNLGLEEALYTIVLSALFAFWARRPRFAGFYLGLLPLLYAPYRFASDFLRIRDVKYLGLTPAQWGTLALLVVGAAILVAGRRRRRTEAPAAIA